MMLVIMISLYCFSSKARRREVNSQIREFFSRSLLRRGKKILPAIILMISLCSYCSSAQQVRFRVTRKNELIGYLVASRTATPETTAISIESVARFSLLLNFNLQVRQNDTFSNGMLRAACFTRTMNGSLRTCHHLQWQNNGYNVSGNGAPGYVQSSPIYYTTASFYFSEPVNITRVYSPNHLAFGALVNISPGVYELTLPGGNKNYYTYKNGVCQKVEANTPWARVYFINEKITQ